MVVHPIKIGSLLVGEGHPCFVIAEIGVNHNGRLDMALEAIAAAKSAGADCAKFQTFKAESVAISNAPKARYQLETTPQTETQLDMLRKLELPAQSYNTIRSHCAIQNILFLSTPYSIEDVDFLESLGVEGYKIASGQLVEHFFLQHVARKKKPIILSTGMATLAEVDEAVRTIVTAGNEQIVLLQCTTNYPSKIEDANLKVLDTFRKCFGLNVGYSDHTQNSTACIAAVSLGACVIEKHFTIDKRLPGPDHSSSANPEEFAELVGVIRETEKALGNGIKEPSPIERENMNGMRRSIVASTAIKSGTTITDAMITFKRPATGISPTRFHEIIGSVAARDIEEDEILSWRDLLR